MNRIALPFALTLAVLSVIGCGNDDLDPKRQEVYDSTIDIMPMSDDKKANLKTRLAELSDDEIEDMLTDVRKLKAAQQSAPEAFAAGQTRADRLVRSTRIMATIKSKGYEVDSVVTDDGMIQAIAIKGDERLTAEGEDHLEAFTKLAETVGVEVE